MVVYMMLCSYQLWFYTIGELSTNDFRRLKELLVELKRIDLKNRVEEFEKKIGATGRIALQSSTKQSMLIYLLTPTYNT